MNNIPFPKKEGESWINALKSGDYKQGKETLVNSSNEYCCLGVLGCVMSIDNNKLRNRDYLSQILPEYSPVFNSLKTPFKPGTTLEWYLAYLNDRENNSFIEIAQFLEENLELV